MTGVVIKPQDVGALIEIADADGILRKGFFPVTVWGVLLFKRHFLALSTWN